MFPRTKRAKASSSFAELPIRYLSSLPGKEDEREEEGEEEKEEEMSGKRR